MKLKLSVLTIALIGSTSVQAQFQQTQNVWGNVHYNSSTGTFRLISVKEAGESGGDQISYTKIFSLDDVSGKASTTYVDEQNAAQDATIATKADKTYVDTELGKKADKTYVDAQNAAQDATIAKGLNFAADTGSFNRQLGDIVTIQGDKNISTVAKDGVINLAMSDNPVFDGLMTIGKGIKVAPTATIDMGGNVISNVGKGAISVASKDAVTGEQVFNLASDVAKNFGAGVAVANDGRLTAPSIKITDAKTGKTTTHKNIGDALGHLNQNQNALSTAVSNLRTDLNHVRGEAYSGTAAAMAVAGLGQPYKPNQTSVGVSSAIYKGRVGLAAGVSRITENGKLLFKGAVNTNNNGQFGAAVSATYYFD